jgi:DNA-directed RNA polymerase specialized sigma24 family protein
MRVPIESPSIPDLNAWPAAQREALKLRYLQDLSFDEIAILLEASSENSRQLVSCAVRKLRKLVQGREKEKNEKNTGPARMGARVQ